MDKLSRLLFLFSMFLVLLVPVHANAQSELKGREQVFEFLGKAFESQVSLSEKGRTMKQVEAVLDPYFTEDYKSQFIEENVIGQENQYQTYGTDFAPYYIPFYAFSDKTKVVDMEDAIYVVEFFPGNGEGPVSYDDHYEGLKLVQEEGNWKVADYLYDEIPEEVINKAYPEKAKAKQAESTEKDRSSAYEGNFVTGPNFSMLKTFMELGVIFKNENRTLLFGLL
ncbi:DUF3993 domain-containing protein [Mesobacillus subterraneus]|uniref:DUF3993 domain-containing protein n=1 Tax=Mesobacillus subterraneus TaxID=285983 RepID=A0A427TUT4_9BACI|nr:DUF3993 domain-containing protein [Mesobacillus subterraneus]RSD28196.1 DUF3993 domain-containing protein [Mesobacillus subterraneus]